MKDHPGQDPKLLKTARTELCEVLTRLGSADQVQAFLEDLCTPAELEAMVDRWRVVPLLKDGKPYRQIHDLTGVSVTTIGRVARFLDAGNGGYETAYAKLARYQR